jgi:hypothetical protein
MTQSGGKTQLKFTHAGWVGETTTSSPAPPLVENSCSA